MAVPTYVSQVLTEGSGAISITAPTRAANDIVVAFIETEAGSTVATPTGWTLLGSQGTTGTNGATATSTKLWVFVRRATNTTADNFSAADPGDHWVSTTFVIRGVPSTLTLSTGLVLAFSAFNTVTTTTVPFPQPTSIAADSFILWAACTGSDTYSTSDLPIRTDNATGGTTLNSNGTELGNGGDIYLIRGRSIATQGTQAPVAGLNFNVATGDFSSKQKVSATLLLPGVLPVVEHIVTGTGAASTASSGAALLVRVATGTAAATVSSSGAAQAVLIASGTAAASAAASGTAALVTSTTGAAASTAGSSGDAALVTAVTGTASAATASAGTAVQVGIATGMIGASASSTGTAVRVHVTAGAISATAEPSGVVVDEQGPATGTVSATAVPAGEAQLIGIATGTGEATATPSGVVALVTQVTGTITATTGSSGVATLTAGDIEVVGWLRPQRWTGRLEPRPRSGELLPARHAGTLPGRTLEGAVHDQRWKGTLQ